MDYTEEDLEPLIKDAAERGRVDLVKYYKDQLTRIQEQKEENGG